uniref:Uncharacterized protein n=1 Tax=Rhizobium phage IG49 TaxID=3129228 RepID=A0AAU8HYL2_9CAUD
MRIIFEFLFPENFPFLRRRRAVILFRFISLCRCLTEIKRRQKISRICDNINAP